MSRKHWKIAIGCLPSSFFHAGFDFLLYNVVDFAGDIGEHIYWRNQTFLGASKVPLTKVGEYDIGYWYASTYNYEEVEINFDKNINIIYGDNAEGKTNLLEAIYMCSTSKSHKNVKDDEH